MTIQPGDRPRIAIVGAGQAGSQLALGLLDRGYLVTLVTDRTPEQVLSGPVMSSQCMFEPALDVEDNSDIPTWNKDAPPILGLEFSVAGGRPIQWSATFDGPARSVDLRLKLSTWLDVFERRGGTVKIAAATLETLESLSRDNDLVVVSTSKGDMAGIFPVDESRTVYKAPQRTLGLFYVKGAQPDPRSFLRMAVAPGVGEFFTFPALTASGTCDVLLFEAIPGGPMDRWPADVPPESTAAAGDGQLEFALDILRTHFPGEAGRFEHAELLGDNAVLHGRIQPEVRHPVGVLPSGATVLGLGGAVVITDPLTSQPSNNAALAANFYLDAILRRGRRLFDDDWKRRTFEAFWRGWASWTVGWTNSLLDGLTAHQLELMDRARTVPGIAVALANCFEDPRTSYRWWFDDHDARDFLTRAEREATAAFDLRDLRAALGNYATGVTIVTTRGADGIPVGVTANSFTSVSLDPPLVLFCPSKTSRSLSAFESASHFAINVLRADQHHLSRQFSASIDDKFKGVDHRAGHAGVPVIANAVAVFECAIVSRYEAGDHLIYVGQVEQYEANGGEPLLFHGGKYHATRPHPDMD